MQSSRIFKYQELLTMLTFSSADPKVNKLRLNIHPLFKLQFYLSFRQPLHL